MASIEEISLGDVVATARRYRPVFAVAAVIFVAALILPAAPRPGGEEFEPFEPQTSGGRTPTTSLAAEPENPATPPTTAFDDSFAFTPAAPADNGSGGFSGGSGGGFVPPPSSGSFDFGSTTTTQQDRPLRTTEVGWASATGGTPVGSTGVPDQSLPVGNRFGQVDKASFVRLAGTARTLYLKEKADGARITSGKVGVRACQVTTKGWKGATNQTFDQAPKWDETICVEGQRNAQGVWSFDTGAFRAPTDDRGLALIPTADASIDFQVAFQQQAVDG